MKQHLSEQELVSIIQQLDMEMAQLSDQQEMKTNQSWSVAADQTKKQENPGRNAFCSREEPSR